MKQDSARFKRGYKSCIGGEFLTMDYKVTDTQLTSIADAIRSKGGISGSLAFPSAFVDAIQNIPSGITPSGSISISQNGTYDVAAFADAVVNVSGGGGSNDNFKIAAGVMSGSIYDSEISFVGSFAFASHSSITGVTMTAVTAIYSSAFNYCYWLRHVSFPLCQYIDNSAFYNCSQLSSCEFPECTSMSNSAFALCSGLITASFPKCESIGASAFYRCSKLETINLTACSLIPSSAFGSCSSLKSINLPMCSIISAYAFASCSALSDVSVPNCEVLGNGAFAQCKSLTQISLPKCSAIGFNAFSDARTLESIYLLSTSVALLSNTNAFSGSPMSTSSYLGRFGSIYVPESLVEAYKTSTGNWSHYADRITAYVE